MAETGGVRLPRGLRSARSALAGQSTAQMTLHTAYQHRKTLESGEGHSEVDSDQLEEMCTPSFPHLRSTLASGLPLDVQVAQRESKCRKNSCSLTDGRVKMWYVHAGE